VSKLSDELYAEFGELRDERAKTDAALDAYVAALTAESLGRTLTYKTTRGDPKSHPLWFALTHLFNHQTHHRSQATTLFMQLGHDPGVTDAIVLLWEDVR